MNSRIYTGHVMHARLDPVKHAFRYPIYCYAFDLDELEYLDRTVFGFGYNRLRPVALFDRDYLDESTGSIRHKLIRLLGIEEENRFGRIVLVTFARYFNYTFRPVSFYFCYDLEDTLSCCVAEVNNTFGERHVYILDDLMVGDNGCVSASSSKAFHVSPFNDMTGRYEFSFLNTFDFLDLRIDLIREGQAILKTQLQGNGVPFHSLNLARVILRQPLTAWLNMPRIMAQAARLRFRKHLPIYRKPNPSSPDTIRIAPPTLLQRFGMVCIFKFLNRLKCGSLKISLPDGSERTCGDHRISQPIELKIRNYNFFWQVLFNGDIGFGESYMAGDWECDKLTDIFKIFIDDLESMDTRGLPLAWMGRIINRWRHVSRSNTPTGSKRNIVDHYDLDNRFFSTFLDETMTYSCALFENPEDTLEQAQRAKLRSVIRKARIGPDDHVLEIGSGWGSFAIEATKSTGCRVTTLTLSKEQQKLAQERIKQAGLQDRIDVQLRDYREVTGRFDRIVSIEMLEAVGHKHFGSFFAALERLLKPNGLVVLQVITIPDQRYRRYRRDVDFIQAHIFPGGLIPSLTALGEAMTKHSRLVIEHQENFNQHYARTLHQWRQRFMSKRKTISSLGFPTEFQRKWEYYLAYCEAGFSNRILNLMQIVLTRPGNRNLTPL